MSAPDVEPLEFRDYCITCGSAPGQECDQICKDIHADDFETETARAYFFAVPCEPHGKIPCMDCLMLSAYRYAQENGRMRGVVQAAQRVVRICKPIWEETDGLWVKPIEQQYARKNLVAAVERYEREEQEISHE